MTQKIVPTAEQISSTLQLFRRELDKNMHNSSGSPGHDAMTVALHTLFKDLAAPVDGGRADVLEEAAKIWPKEYTESKDLKLLMADTATGYANYPPYVNLTMIRREGAVKLTVRLPTPDGTTEGKTGCVFFTREMWNKFVGDIARAQTIYSAADYLDSIL